MNRLKVPSIKTLDFYVTDISYSDHQLVFATTGTDSKIHLWNFTDNKIKYLKYLSAPTI
jgi:hypothetical protein